MLQRKDPAPVLHFHGFLVGVDLEEGINPEGIGDAIAESLTWREGVGKADVTHLGVIQTIEDTE